LAPGTFVVVVLVVLALGAARLGAAIKAAAATDAINFFIASSCLRQESAGGGPNMTSGFSWPWKPG
jgi:hypothetical protein